ncbi:MAG: DUF91 domain-containing protein [Chloroflexi bacterium]|nr:DUF91 domain-containing protein [Chloroflexota bacterium]
MPLYRWNDDNLEPVPPTTFEAEGLQERTDLQRLLRDQPDVLEEGLFIVVEDFSNWQDSSRSIDLLALDAEGNLVVIELKRTQTGDHSELQAIRYAAMVSNMTLEQVIAAHRYYLQRRDIDGDATDRVLSHLGVHDDADAEIHTERPRIILASAGFSTELTTSVLWLRDGDMNISCVRLQLYKDGNGLLMDASQVIPLPEASDYLVKVREREETERRPRRNTQPERIPGADAFLERIDKVQEYSKPMLKQLYDWAVSLEQEDLAILETRKTSDGFSATLRVSLPDARVNPATIWQAGRSVYYHLRLNEIGVRAPKASIRIGQILGPENVGEDKSRNFYSVPDDLLDALTDAYREANGLPPTTLPPDTAPDSPLPVA